MKPSERDQLLTRLDERSRNTWVTIEKMEQHFVKLNSNTDKNTTGVAVNRKSIGLLWKIVLGIPIGGGAIVGALKAFDVY